MVSLSVNTLKPLPLLPPSTIFNPSHSFSFSVERRSLPKPKPISAIISSSSSPFPIPDPPADPQQLYQPFRPPPSPLPPQFESLDLQRRFEILADRLGLWYEYAPLISSLIREGFSPPSIEEATGISGVEQNRLVVAAQVRDSLVQSNADPDTLSFFDTGGAELLYEIRLLSASQRAAAARFIVLNKFDGKGAQDLARAIKDFPRRRGDRGWESFDYKFPGDCLAFMHYRQSREYKNPSEQRTAWLEQALSVAETEKAKKTISEDLRGDKEEKEDQVEKGVRVPVVRLKMGEVAEATSVVVLPVCKAEERDREVVEAPLEYKSEGSFGVVVAEKGWERWVVLPQWEPLAFLGKGGGVVVSFPDGRVLPWTVNRWYKEEPVLVVADRTNKKVLADDGFYLVKVDEGDHGLKVERGSALKKVGVEDCLGTVVLVVRPPRDDIDDQLSDEDWE